MYSCVVWSYVCINGDSGWLSEIVCLSAVFWLPEDFCDILFIHYSYYKHMILAQRLHPTLPRISLMFTYCFQAKGSARTNQLKPGSTPFSRCSVFQYESCEHVPEGLLVIDQDGVSLYLTKFPEPACHCISQKFSCLQCLQCKTFNRLKNLNAMSLKFGRLLFYYPSYHEDEIAQNRNKYLIAGQER